MVGGRKLLVECLLMDALMKLGTVIGERFPFFLNYGVSWAWGEVS